MTIYTDGASRGNPGPVAIGVAAYLSNIEPSFSKKELFFLSKYMGNNQTNNWAEYQAVIAALEEAQKYKITKVLVKSDSELIVRQINGQYKAKNPNIIQLYKKVQELLKFFVSFKFVHIPREENKRADKLANLALDQKLGKS